MSSLQGPLALCLSFSGQQRMPARSQTARKKASFRQRVLSCLILGSELKRVERWAA